LPARTSNKKKARHVCNRFIVSTQSGSYANKATPAALPEKCEYLL